MTNTLRIKRRTSGSPGAPTSLENAELAYNEVDDVLYYGKGTGGAGGTATTIPAIAGSGAYMTLSTAQTISGNKTFSGTVSLGSLATATTPATSDNSTTVATTAYVKAQGIGSGTVTSVALSLPSFITVSGSPVTTTGTLTGTLASQTANTVFIAPNGSAGAPTFRLLADADIPSLTAAKISNFDTQVRTSRLDQMAAPTASVSLNSQRITNLGTPTLDTDAATKAYVDAARTGLDVKDSVRAASTANVTVTYAATGGTSARGQITAAPNTLDGVTLANGNRILLKDQSTGAQNGIWVVTTVGTGANGVWDRATDFDADAEVTAGAFTFVTEGTVNGDSGWVLTTNDAIVIGGASGTALTFAQFSGAGQITAGAGLTKTGNTIDVATASTGRIVVNADNIDLASGIATPGTYQAVTVDTYGRVTGGSNPTTLAGYGISDAQPLDATLTALAGTTVAANQLIYATGADAFTTTSFTAFGRSLVDDADAAAGRTTLGLGTMATQNANTVAITGGSITGIIFDGGTF